MTKSYPFESDGRYTYGFTSSGLFTLLTKDGESLYDEVVPLCEKLGGHLLWIFLWIVVIVAANLIPSDRLSLILGRLFMSLIFVHLFLFGCRLTTLLIKGGFRPIFFPPLWMRLTRKLQQGRGLDLLKEHRLEQHPGLLVNLALVQFSQNHLQEGRELLNKAHTLCPDHPDISQIVTATARLS